MVARFNTGPDCSPDITVSGDGLTLTPATTGWRSGFASVFGLGNLYYEVTIGAWAGLVTAFNSSSFGFTNKPTTSWSTGREMYHGFDLSGYFLRNGSNMGQVALTFAQGDTLMLAQNYKGDLWVGKNGSWFGGNNPADGLNPISSLAGAIGIMQPIVNLYTSTLGISYTFKFANPQYTVPTGFSLFESFPSQPLIDVDDYIAAQFSSTIPDGRVYNAKHIIEGARNFYFGGRGLVTGTTKNLHNPTNTPVSRRVRLLRDIDSVCVAETWSNASTGYYEFRYVDPLPLYTVIAFDHTGIYGAVIADRIAAEVI